MGWEEGRFETCPYRGESEGGNVRKMDSRPRLYGGGRFAGKRDRCVGITVGLGGRAVREPPLRERMLSGTGFTPIPRLHEGRL